MFGTFRDLWDDSDARVILGFLLLLIGLIAVFVWAAIEENRRWEVFKIEHKCKPVSQIKGSTLVGVSSGNQVVITQEPDKTGWLCDDGITYYK